jgi:predicted nucleic acid-binding protein
VPGTFLPRIWYAPDSALTLAFLRDLSVSGVQVELSPIDVIPRIESDPDDDVVVACALAGGATHLVTYDPHFQILGDHIDDVKILDGLHFLYIVRGDKQPQQRL